MPKRSAISAFGDVGVLHHVVEERGDQRLRVEVPVGDQRTHRHRVADIGLAADAELTGVGIGGEVVGRLDAAHVLGPEVGLQLGLELLEVEREHARHRRAEDFGGLGLLRRLSCNPRAISGLAAVEHLEADLARFDLAQRDHGRLCPGRADRRRSAACRQR